MHTNRPFVVSSSRKQVFQLLRRISGTGSAPDRRSLHLVVDDDHSSSGSPAMPTAPSSGDKVEKKSKNTTLWLIGKTAGNILIASWLHAGY
jgi:hypothetical protein